MPFDFPIADVHDGRARRGARNFHAGASAEHSVEKRYLDAGFRLLERRWRGKGGEIDLIFQDAAGTFVFVEVKQGRDRDRAIARITPRQITRIHAAAEEYLGATPLGLLSETRFDAALVDGTGQIEVLEGALLGY